MPKSTRLFPFPDVNVWVALTYQRHRHYSVARKWLDSLPDDAAICFCRITQLGFLRLLTTAAVMENEVLSQASAWSVYDDWQNNGRAIFVEEPPSVERVFRALSQLRQAAPKDWADSYLSAFAQVCGLRLVTFDQALQKRTTNSILLQS